VKFTFIFNFYSWYLQKYRSRIFVVVVDVVAIIIIIIIIISGFGGLDDACWHLVPKFAGSNPAEAVGFFRAKKSPARLHSEGK
jgi:uncharacterized membrane protein